MSPENDRDMKIFGKEKKSSDFDVLNIVNALDKQRENNNIAKAKDLGRELAKNCFTKEFLSSVNFKYEEDSKASIQVLSLVFFAVKASMNLFLPSPVLFPICEDSFYEKLRDKKPEFYGEMVKNPALSFYYLSLRKTTDKVDMEIAQDFAKFCDKKGNEEYISEGKRIYNYILDYVSKLIIEKNFNA